MLTLRERAAGMYCASAYFFSRSFTELLFIQIPSNFLFIVCAYWLIGFQVSKLLNVTKQSQKTAGGFFGFYLVIGLASLASTSVALFIATIGRTVDMAITILPFILEVFKLFAGMFTRKE